MAGMMLRWTGGQAGDILMHIIAQNKKVYLNFNPIEVSQSGQLVGKPIRDARYPTLTNLPYVQFDPVQKHTPIDYNQLRKDILQIKKDYEHFVIRFFVHDKTFDQNVKDIITIFDIGSIHSLVNLRRYSAITFFQITIIVIVCNLLNTVSNR